MLNVSLRSLLKIIKTRLEGAKGIWPEELPSVLWAYRTTARTPTRETPFRLTYGSEAVIPAEVGITSYRVHNHDENRNDEAMRLQLDLMDEDITNKLHSPYALPLTLAQREKRIFTECIGVVPAKHPLKIKSELFSIL